MNCRCSHFDVAYEGIKFHAIDRSIPLDSIAANSRLSDYIQEADPPYSALTPINMLQLVNILNAVCHHQ